MMMVMVMMAMVMMKMRMMMTHIGEGVGLLCSALSLAGGVTQCKDDGSFIEACHILDDLISEGSGYSSSAWKRGWSRRGSQLESSLRVWTVRAAW